VFAEAGEVDVLISDAPPAELAIYETLGMHCISVAVTDATKEQSGVQEEAINEH
jgi:hypothetical protein